LERQIKASSVEEHLPVREDHAVPILDDLQAWMIAEYPKVPPKSPIAKALAYSMKRWEQLKVYTTDGRLEVDNNKIENEIRPIALGRKNLLFAGSHESAQRIAMVYSLLATVTVEWDGVLISGRSTFNADNQCIARFESPVCTSNFKF
jgi:hypothetical protein